jgi:hypothetical protein
MTEDIGQHLFGEIEICIGGGKGFYCKKCNYLHKTKPKECNYSSRETNWELIRKKFKAEFNPDEEDISFAGHDWHYEWWGEPTDDDKLDWYIKHYHESWLEEQEDDDSNYLYSVCDSTEFVNEYRKGWVIDRHYPELDYALQELNRLKEQKIDGQVFAPDQRPWPRVDSKHKTAAYKRKQKRKKANRRAKKRNPIPTQNEDQSTIVDGSTTSTSEPPAETNSSA